MSTKDTAITLFSSCRETTGKQITIATFLKGVAGPLPEVVAKIEQIRELAQAGKTREVENIKKTLPAVTLSGSFRARNAEQLEEHSGIVALDFDGLSKDDLGAARRDLEADPHVAFVFLSPSGQGIKGGCRIPTCDDAEGHTAAWLACERYFQETYALTLDPSGKDVSRLCFVSHDSGTFINWQAGELDVDAWRPLTKDEEETRRLHELMETCHFKGIRNPPPETLPVLLNERGDVLGEAGNLLLLQGAVKGGKTTLGSGMLAALVGTPEGADTLGIVAPPAPGHILHFDCEQGAKNHFRLMNTVIRKRCQLDTDPHNLHSFTLLDVDLSDRWPLVEHTAEAHARSGPIRAVFFDGGADFLASMNDEVTAFEMVDRQFKFARKWECLVIVVIHENPGADNGKIRGHYGSQLHRKCQTALAIEKGADDISSVYGHLMRDGCWPKSEATHFLYDVTAGMHIECKDPTTERQGRKDAAKAGELRQLAESVLSRPMRYGELVTAIEKKENVATSTAKGRVKKMREGNIIEENEDGTVQIKN